MLLPPHLFGPAGVVLYNFLGHGGNVGQVAGLGNFLDEAAAAFDVNGVLGQVGSVGDLALDEEIVYLGRINIKVGGDAATAALLPAFFGRVGGKRYAEEFALYQAAA